MAEYKNGFNAFGGIPVDSSRLSSDVQTGRAVYVNEDEYSDEPDYKNRVDQTVNEGYHREAPFEAPEIVIPEPIIPSGTKDISENGLYDVAQFAKANVNVAGGGGSSDFSTATVTIVNNTAGTLDSIYMPHAMAADAEQGSPDISMPVFLSGIPIETSSYNAILYKGSCYFDYLQYSTPYSTTPVEITGSAEKIFDGAIVITGDCTITIGSH